MTAREEVEKILRRHPGADARDLIDRLLREEQTRPCHWYDDQDPEGEGRWLVPGCMYRVHDPDTEECTCPLLTDQLDEARSEAQDLRQELRALRHWYGALKDTVRGHRDGAALERRAAEAAGRAPHG